MKDWIKKNIYDPTDGKPAVAVAGGAAPPQAGVSLRPPMPGSASPGGAGMVQFVNVDQQMVADVKKVIERRPTPYRTLMENADTLAEALPDEMSRTRAAFAMLKKQGANAAQVISSIDLHIRDIEGEKASVSAGAKQAVDRQAGQLRAEAEQLLNANQSDINSIQNLETQITAMRDRMNERSIAAAQKTSEAGRTEADIQVKTQQFNSAADSIITSLNNQKTTLSSMLN